MKRQRIFDRFFEKENLFMKVKKPFFSDDEKLKFFYHCYCERMDW